MAEFYKKILLSHFVFYKKFYKKHNKRFLVITLASLIYIQQNLI